MTRWAKSGCPVIGQMEVNSGTAKRTRNSVPRLPFGTRSRTASAGDAGSRAADPSWVSCDTSVLIIDLFRAASLIRTISFLKSSPLPKSPIAWLTTTGAVTLVSAEDHNAIYALWLRLWNACSTLPRVRGASAGAQFDRGPARPGNGAKLAQRQALTKRVTGSGPEQ